MNKRIVAFLILGAMLSSLAACGDSASDGDVTTNSSTETAEPVDTDHDSNGFLLDSIPADTNFGGATVNILIREAVANTEFFVEEETGDIVDDALYERNATVE